MFNEVVFVAVYILDINVWTCTLELRTILQGNQKRMSTRLKLNRRCQ